VHDFRLLDKGSPLKADAPNAAVGMVATRITEIDLTMLDDGIVPVGHVDSTVGAHIDIDRAESAMSRRDEVLQLGGGVGAALVGELEQIDTVPAEVGRGEDVLEVIGHMTPAEDLKTAVLRLAGIEAREDAGRPG